MRQQVICWPTMLRIGPHTIDFPFVLAPMAGITDTVFRSLMKEHGAGVVVSELVSCHGIINNSGKTFDLLAFDEVERPVGLQIFGEDEDILGAGAAAIERLGADFVDLNFGCPVQKVVKKGAGAAMLRDPRRLERVLKSVRRHITIPLTIKIRAGWDDSERNAPDVVKAAAEAGVTWVAIHGRTRLQGYSGQADWDLIARCKQAAGSFQVIGNGDILTAEEAIRRQTESGCDGVMIGRGALRNPWIFDEIRALKRGERLDPATFDVIELLRRHRQLLDRRGLVRTSAIVLRKFAAWYSHGYPKSAVFRRQIFQAPTLDEVEALSVAFYETVRHIPMTEKGCEFFLNSGHG